MDPPTAEQKPRYKSWRKKYRKMKLRFEQLMRDSDQLFREEQKALETTRRIVEENEQILDILLDAQSHPGVIPDRYRFNLCEPALNVDHIMGAYRKMKTSPQDLPAAAFAQLPNSEEFPRLDDIGADKTGPTSIFKLLTVPHSRWDPAAPPSKLPEELRSSSPPPTYLSPTHEDEYLSFFDNVLLGSISDSASPSAASHQLHSSLIMPAPIAPKPQSALTEREKEREIALKNPVSVYNWLRKHQPQVFLQDNEGQAAEKPGPSSNKKERGAGGKRASVAAASAKNNAAEPAEFPEAAGSNGRADAHRASGARAGSISTPPPPAKTTTARGKRKRDEDAEGDRSKRKKGKDEDSGGSRSKSRTTPRNASGGKAGEGGGGKRTPSVGGSARPTKRKREKEKDSEGGSTPAPTPVPKKIRKSAGAGAVSGGGSNGAKTVADLH